jgi:hypothetical protein
VKWHAAPGGKRRAKSNPAAFWGRAFRRAPRLSSWAKSRANFAILVFKLKNADVLAMDWSHDLTPFFADRCWQFGILARQAPIGVLIRRGPSKWWRLTLWNTRNDEFTGGQWFHGSLYPQKCDLSPDGKLFSYFAAKFQRSARERSYDYSWAAVSRPPYFTALTLWNIGDTWGGKTAFLDDGSFHVGAIRDPHPDHPLGPLRIAKHSYLALDDPFLATPAWARTGWTAVPLSGFAKKLSAFDPLIAAWKKVQGDYCLRRAVERGEELFPSGSPSEYTILDSACTTELTRFRAHWADFDQNGRLVAAAGGRILEGQTDPHHGVRWRQLAAFHEQKPERMEAPTWAQRW